MNVLVCIQDCKYYINKMWFWSYTSHRSKHPSWFPPILWQCGKVSKLTRKLDVGGKFITVLKIDIIVVIVIVTVIITKSLFQTDMYCCKFVRTVNCFYGLFMLCQKRMVQWMKIPTNEHWLSSSENTEICSETNNIAL